MKPWPGVRDATAHGPNCVQDSPDTLPGPQSEDCLSLSVTVPRSADPHRPRPVLVWIHGGGFHSGAGGYYGARRLAAEGDMVVVTPNYRLGIFGFFGLPGLAGSGSFGVQDQQAALRWVRHNIRAFGGDPGNVTLAGESAGAMSACAHLTAPGSAGLFHRVIMQSGSCMSDWPEEGRTSGAFTALSQVVQAGSNTAAALGCTTVTCMRGKPSGELVPSMKQFVKPAYGTRTLPENPPDALRAHRFHPVPVLSGTTRDENTSYTASLSALSADEYRTTLAEDFGPAAGPEVAKQYPPVDGDNRVTLAAVYTDRIWAHTTRNAQLVLSKRVPVFAFEFADRTAPLLPGQIDPGFPLGAYHGSEIPYLFDLADFSPPPFTRGQWRLSGQMIQHWARFARTGTAQWPRFPYVRAFAPHATGPVDYAAEHHLAFWERYSG